MNGRRRSLRAVRGTVRVLIVDDHALFAEALMLTLGIDDRLEVVGHAANGVEALTLARALRPDVVLMDLHMPGMDGIQATKALRQSLPAVRVVMLTASHAPEHVRWAREAGAVRYATKDTSALELLDIVLDVATIPRASVFAAPEPAEPTPLGRTA